MIKMFWREKFWVPGYAREKIKLQLGSRSR